MTATENPIDNDDRLKGLLSSIQDVKTRKAYNSWRKAFLKIYCEYLDPNGILNGKDANYRLLQQLQQLSNRIELVVKGPLQTPGAIASANGRRLLTNLTDQVRATERKVQELLPKTDADEERFGFDKFELAAVLLEDGFHGYDALLDSRVVLDSIARHIHTEDPDETVYTNELTILRHYADSVESLVHVMEDLKLVRVMTQCVEVVYKGKDRPEPKPPPPPEEPVEHEHDYDMEDEELPEDSSICSDFDLLDVAETPVGNATPSSSDLEEEDDEPTTTEHKKPKTKKKKKKSTSTKKPKGKDKSSASSTPAASGKKKKTKKPKKSARSKEEYATTSGDDTDDVLDEEDEDLPRRSTAKAKPKPSRKNGKNRSAASQDDDDDEDEDESSSNTNDDDDEEDDDDQEEGPPPESEFLLFFDPKTNSIGRIDRAQAVAQSSLLTDKSKEGTAQGAYGDDYRNVIDSQDEKQEIIFMLKKLERQKPQEESWLDAIKKEKAAAKAANGSSNTAPKKFHKSTSRISRRNSATSSSKTSSASSNPSKKSGVGMGRQIVGSGGTYTSPLKADKKPVDAESIKAQPTFRNPLESATNDNTKSSRRLSNKTGGDKSKKKNNYKEIYKQVADKPDASGWSKPASSRGLLQ